MRKDSSRGHGVRESSKGNHGNHYRREQEELNFFSTFLGIVNNFQTTNNTPTTEAFLPMSRIPPPSHSPPHLLASTADPHTPPPPPSSSTRSLLPDEDVSSLMDYQLDEKIEAYRRHISTMKLPDDNFKLRLRLQMYENEKERRRAEKQAEFPLNGNTSAVNKSLGVTKRQSVMESPESVVDQDCREIACNIKESVPRSPVHSLKDDVFRVNQSSSETMICTPIKKSNYIHDLESIPSGQKCKVCHCLLDNMLASCSEHEKVDTRLCSSCRARSSLDNATENVRQLQREQKFHSPTNCATEKSSSGKRLHQAVGDTPDTALELSDGEENMDEKVVSCSAGKPCSTELPRRKSLRSTAKKMEGAKILYPSSHDPEAVEVQYADLQHLAPLQFLNDTVIDFYIKYIQMEKISDKAETLGFFHFFSCFFYKILMSWKESKGIVRFEKLRKWTKGVNIFTKSYLFVPIHDSSHWSLTIVCFREDHKPPYILHLDSMSPAAGHSSEIIFKILKSYLATERNHLLQDRMVEDAVLNVEPSKAICRRVQVPRQDNEWDCGLFMLYYVERFVKEAPSHMDASTLAKMFGQSWFKPIEASQLRDTILTLLESIFDQKC